MNGLIPVEGKDGWYRDPDSNAIVNANTSDYDKYMATYISVRKRFLKRRLYKMMFLS
mgnify:CR=1 FL=1